MRERRRREGGPHQEYRIDALEAFLSERADLLSVRRQLRDNLAANISGGANDQGTAHLQVCW
jgi:hypothetical protein